MSDFEKNLDKTVENYEKTFDKASQVVDKASVGVSRLLTGCAFLLANLFFMAFCLWGVYAVYTSWQLEQNGERATGTVITLEESSDSDGSCCAYSPVIEFQANGQSYTFESNNASNPPAYKVGQSVPVLYDPADPANAQINRWSERWLMPIILIPAMIFASLITSFFLIQSWRRKDDILSSL